MTYLVALDDGHGMETPGKRTPIFPPGSGMVSELGENFMHENEFNRAVVAKMKVHLERCGIKTLLVAAGDKDVPLKTRTDLANAKGANVYVSIHANANTGKWGNAKGVETYCYPGAKDSRKLAEIVHKYLIQHTPQVNRGVREADLHVLRETKMPAILIEAGFMDNLEEAKLLLSDAFRSEVAEEASRGVCEYLGVAWVDEKKPESAKPAKPTVHEINVEVNGKKLAVKGFNRDGTTFVPVRAVAEALGISFGWDDHCKKAIINSVILDKSLIVDSHGYAWSREVADAIGYQVAWDGQSMTIKLFK
jgi:N-acetylmuramoyl-L-alanine amidase